MMRRIYIDANIYLRFYLLDQPLFQKVLPVVTGIEEDIFSTRQIADEVRRNKINAFLAHAGNFFAQIPKSPNLPAFDTGADIQKSKTWRKKVSTLKTDIEACSTEYKASIKAMAHSIADSTDPVSIQLEKIFSNSGKPTEAQLTRARLRKELGNPPGKRSDPLGDQISWEQFLDQCKKDQSVWIITRDGDFFDVLIDELRLKPTLEADLRKKIGAQGKIYLFDDLLTGLESFKADSGKRINNLPSKAEIKKIHEEQTDNLRTGNTQIFADPLTYTTASALLNSQTAIKPLTATDILNSSVIRTPTLASDVLNITTTSTTIPTIATNFFTIGNSASSIADILVNRGAPISVASITASGWTCQYCNSYNTNNGLFASSICTNCYKSRS